MQARKRILLVDDEPDIIRLVSFKLRKEGYEVIAVDSGREALNFVHNEPDLILLDLLLPDMHGYEVCKRIKADHRLGNIPIILFTANANEINKLSRKVKQLGVQGYVVKPFDWEELLSKIRKYI